MSQASVSFLPANAVIELTYRCNHSCLFCSCPWFRKSGGFQILPELNTAEWKKVLDRLCGCGVSSMAFTGGEALLREDCLELLEYASSLKVMKTETVGGALVTREAAPELYLLSNGLPVDTGVLEELARLRVKLSLSLPGLSTFQHHTGHDHSDMVLERFRMAREHGVPTTVNTTVTALNLNELRKTLTAAFLAGADQLLMNRFLPGGRGLENLDELSLSAEQALEMLATADDVLTRAGRAGALGTEMPLCLVNRIDLHTLQVGTRCSAAVKFFVVGPSGYIRVCNHSEERLDHISRWRDLKYNGYWNTFTMKRYLPPECGGCRLKLDCDGGCREAAHITGDRIDAADPLL